jgi:hypothetical protein
VGSGAPASPPSAGSSGTGTPCSCPVCQGGSPCPPCNCGEVDAGAPANPCGAHTDATSCLADTADACKWYALGIACQQGQTCPSGVCQQAPSGGGGGGNGCACACPACAPGQACPPCSCTCDSGGGTCTPPPPDAGVICPGLGCAPACPNGVKKDANGCDTCQCK